MTIDYKKLAEESSKADKTLMKELVKKAQDPSDEKADAAPAKKPKAARRKPQSAPGADSPAKDAATSNISAFEVKPPEKEKLTVHANLLITESLDAKLRQLVKDKGFRSYNAAANAILEAYFAGR